MNHALVTEGDCEIFKSTLVAMRKCCNIHSWPLVQSACLVNITFGLSQTNNLETYKADPEHFRAFSVAPKKPCHGIVALWQQQKWHCS